MATRDAHPLLEEIALRWSIWRCKGTLWKIFNRWQLGCIFLLLIASTLLLSSQYNLRGTFLVLPVMSYLARCFEATWPEAAEAYTARLLARARKAHQSGSLGRALRLARRAEALTRNARTHAQAVELQGRILVQQGCGAAVLRELSRTSSHEVLSATLRVHLLTGESSIALALAQRMFARAPKPDTARLISQALLQFQRPEEARHFANMAGGSETSHPATPAPTPQAGPAPRPWEIPLLRGLGVSWTLATPSSRGGAGAGGGEPRLCRDGGGAEEGAHTPFGLGRAAEKDVRPGCVRVLEVWRQA
ncbi:hypothetical protein [Hyalangium sp.]|uniref:hypothetical protein n=1 Tax=Hyalangium sp. TaxID=2028555 RepID=UPI002D2B7D15|nr:hypothetical protein [Hyalangium sp.]HYH97206.1 hypothetical protein [Hyalangium sp.]